METTADTLRSDRARRSALYVGLLVALITTSLCLIAMNSLDQGPLAFAVLGTRFSEGDPEGTKGYDGQFAYYIARDGAASQPLMDGAALRFQRILYPALSRALSLGNGDLLPWVMVAINIAAHSAGAALIAYLAVLWRGPALAGLIYGLWIGGQFGVRLNLSEPLCFALALGAIAAYIHRRMRWTIALLILSTLTKELGLIFAAGLALHALSQRQGRWAALIFGGPALAFGVWWLIMLGWFGTLPTIYPAARGIRFLPLNGFFSVSPSEFPAEFVFLLLFLVIPSVVLFAAAAVRVLRRRSLSLGDSLMFAGAGFVFFMPDVSWQDQLAAYRVASSVVICGLLFVAEAAPRRMKWLGALWLPALVLMALSPLWFSAGS